MALTSLLIHKLSTSILSTVQKCSVCSSVGTLLIAYLCSAVRGLHASFCKSLGTECLDLYTPHSGDEPTTCSSMRNTDVVCLCPSPVQAVTTDVPRVLSSAVVHQHWFCTPTLTGGECLPFSSTPTKCQQLCLLYSYLPAEQESLLGKCKTV